MALDDEGADGPGAQPLAPVPPPGPVTSAVGAPDPASRGPAAHPGPVSERAAAFWRDNRRALVVAAVGTVLLRVITEWIGLVSEYGIEFPHEVAERPSLLVDVWGHWDAGFYLSIARYGYAGRVAGPGQAAHGIAFAPLYPWGIRLVHTLTPWSWWASAELLSALALFVALAALYRLAASFGGDDMGGTSVLLLLAFPTGFFLLAPYPSRWRSPSWPWPSSAPGRSGGCWPVPSPPGPRSPSTTW